MHFQWQKLVQFVPVPGPSGFNTIQVHLHNSIILVRNDTRCWQLFVPIHIARGNAAGPRTVRSALPAILSQCHANYRNLLGTNQRCLAAPHPESPARSRPAKASLCRVKQAVRGERAISSGGVAVRGR